MEDRKREYLVQGHHLTKPDQNHVVVRIGKKLVAWVFGYEQNYHLYVRHVLPWALPHAEIVDVDHWDFTVFVARFYDDSYDAKLNFVICAEAGRYPKVPDRTFVFTQDEHSGNDSQKVRYCPTMIHWCPPMPNYKKLKAASVIDSGKYSWRVDLIRRAQALIPDLEVFGGLSGKIIPGYHDIARKSPYANEKYVALRDHAFVLAIERDTFSDYITEKVIDPILMGSVPVYRGAPNILQYFVPGSFIQYEEIGLHDWKGWRDLYRSRVDAVRAQYEVIRSKFNVFSYFDILTSDLSLLSKMRPITL